MASKKEENTSEEEELLWLKKKKKNAIQNKNYSVSKELNRDIGTIDNRQLREIGNQKIAISGIEVRAVSKLKSLI